MSSRKHKYAQDLKNQRIAGPIKKLGGQEKTDENLAQWVTHRQSENNNDR